MSLLGSGRTDGNQSMSDFDAVDLLSEPLVDSNSDLGGFGDDFEPTPMRADFPEKSSSSNQRPTDFSMFEPTPIRTTGLLPQQQPAPNRTVIDNQGFPVTRPDSSIPSIGILPTPPQQQTAFSPMVHNHQNHELQKALLQLRQVQQMQQQQQRQQEQRIGMNGIIENHPMQLNQVFGQPNSQASFFHLQQRANFNAAHNHAGGSMAQQPQLPLNHMANAALGEGMPPQQQQQQCPPNTLGASTNLPEYSHAMEKLCETMRRSAMSRTMVKQLSGRSLPTQGSSRSLPKQGSSRSLTKPNSGRKTILQKQLSARKLSRQSSSNSVDLTTASTISSVPSMGHLTPTRVPGKRSISSKHRIARDGSAHGEDIVRQNSASALLGNHLRALQKDETNAGWWLGDAESICSGDTRFSGKTV